MANAAAVAAAAGSDIYSASATCQDPDMDYLI